MRNKKKPSFLLALVLTSLMLSTTACVTTKIEYVRDIPAVIFPVFPPPDIVEYDSDTDIVSMPLWYWQKIAEYKIDIDAVKEYLDKLREAAKKHEAEVSK